MIASRIGRAGTRFGPTRFGGSSSAMIGSAIAHSSSGTRQIGGNGGRSFFFLAILHLRLSRPCRPGASLEIVTKLQASSCSLAGTHAPERDRRIGSSPSRILVLLVHARVGESPTAVPTTSVVGGAYVVEEDQSWRHCRTRMEHRTSRCSGRRSAGIC